MELNKALKQLVDAKGFEFLKNPMIINIISCIILSHSIIMIAKRYIFFNMIKLVCFYKIVKICKKKTSVEVFNFFLEYLLRQLIR